MKFRFFIALLFWRCLLEGKEPALCLAMAVKNDKEVVERCLKSVESAVDCICICDLGSIDGTIAAVEKFLFESGIPGKVFECKEESAARDKTLSVQCAQTMLKGFGVPLSDAYLLVLEPDMILRKGSSFQKSGLRAEACLILEKSALGLCIYNPRLLRASLPWENDDPVIDLWSHGNTGIQSEKIFTLMAENQKSKERTEKKLQGDIDFLTETLQKEPGHLQRMFYLAQSHRCLKHYDDAIHWYKARVAVEEARDEVWFSKYMLGECYEEMGAWDQALYWYLEAYHQNPDRAESLRNVATYYRMQGRNDIAHIFAKYGSLIPCAKDPFIAPFPPLNYQFDEELSITSFYTRFKDDGDEASHQLMLKRNVPYWIKDQAYRNYMFYVKRLSGARFQAIECALPPITKGSDERYHPMNPAIQKTEEGYRVICRAVNYTQTGAKIFNTIEPDGVFRTKNFLLEYDRDFKLLSQHEIVENLPREKIRFVNIEGLDDCRIFGFKGSSWFTCTTNDTNPAGNFQISLCKLADQAEGGALPIETLIPLNGPDPHRCEKNWLPFVKDGLLYLVYSYDPLIVYQPDLETGDCEAVVESKPAYDFSRFRGSAGPIEFDGGYLLLVHEVVYLPDYSRCYLHRFLHLDRDFAALRTSKPFIFRHNGIEFCCSMAADHAGKELIMAVGVEDREAYLCSVDLGDIKQLLGPLPSLNEQIFIE